MRILFLAPLPPPITGHALVSKVLLDHLSQKNKVVPVDLSVDSFSDGSISFSRLLAVSRVFWKIIKWRYKQGCVYFTISESFAGNMKDLLIYFLLLGKWNRLFLHLHGGTLGDNVLKQHSLLRRLNATVFRRVGGIIISGESHRIIFSDFIQKQRLHIVPNFAPEYMFRTLDEVREKFSQKQPLRVLFLSNMNEKKGYLDVLDGYLGLPEEIRQYIWLDFAGKFDSTSNMVKFESRIEYIPNVAYHGIVNDHLKMELFSRSHILCLPTRFQEGQPIAILEAYASGCIVLTTNQPGINDVFQDQVNGHYVAKASPDSIREVLYLCFYDPEEMLKMAMYNRLMAENSFRVEKFVKRIENLIAV